MRNILLTFILLGFSFLFKAQNQSQNDIWSGSYEVYPKDDKKALDTLFIAKTKDVKSEDVPARFESDLKRWIVTSKKDERKDALVIRRFIFNLEDDDNEYEQFGWTKLYQEEKISCIDGCHFFICQTKPNTTVDFQKEGTFFTKTGFFGVWLHFGLVELKKLD
ncbi:MAG: phosphate ABC transporter permease [Chryseobacterium sp.]|nr:phosphate ABC transporter permease [Chryseobacterium sp.]